MRHRSRCLAIAANLAPSGTILTSDEQVIFDDPRIQVVVLATLADFRKDTFSRRWNTTNM